MFVLEGGINGYSCRVFEKKRKYALHMVADDIKYFKFTKFPRQGSKKARLVAISPKKTLSEYDVAVGVDSDGRMVQFCMVTDTVDGTYFREVNPRVHANNSRYNVPYDVLHMRFFELFERVLQKHAAQHPVGAN